MLKIKSFLFWLNCFIPIILIASFGVNLYTLYEIGEQIGRLSLIILWLILLPGMIQRLNLKGNIAKIGQKLKIIRRQLGILVFGLGVLHYCWMTLFFYLQRGFPTNPNQIPIFQVFGFWALLLFLPLYLTSNNLAVKFMRKAWFWLHRLIYLATLLLVFHIGLNSKISGIILGAITSLILLFELISWIYIGWQKYLNIKTKQI